MARFFCDDKYGEVIAYLQELGWTLVKDAADLESEESSGQQLLWTNLKKVDWSSVGSKTINHLHGSQHLSNKAYLAYHMAAAGFNDVMPLQWSSAYQDLAQLVGMVAVDALYSFGRATEGGSSLLNEHELRGIVNLLHTDAEWSTSCDGELTKELVASVLSPSVSQSPIEDEVLERLKAAHPRFSYSGTGNLWIVKPVGLSCGANIKLVRGMKALLDVVGREMNFKCVVQKYIERPLLVKGGRKFDIRQWLLVTSVEPLVIYGFSEFYCRLSWQEYNVDADGLADPTIHLTNHAIQKMRSRGGGGDGDVDDINRTVECDTMLTHAQFEEELQKMASPPSPSLTPSIIDQVLLPQIKNISIKCVASVRDKLEKIGGGFEWLGLDLMVTDSLQVLLIECNVSPDISLSTSVTSRVVKAAVRETCALVMGTTTTTTSAPSPSSPSWNLWFPENSSPPLTSVLAFARSKRERGGALGKDYSPKKLELFYKVQTLLSSSSGKKGDEDEDEF